MDDGGVRQERAYSDVSRLLIGGAALLSLAAMPLLIKRERRFLHLYVAIAALALPYVIVESLLRYRYPISTPTIFIACDATARVLA